MEGVAANFYWKSFFEQKFKRERFGDYPNNFLNYGYALLRAATARALSGSGLLNTLGIHHKSKYNAFALADDIMEPFRPIVDEKVFELMQMYDEQELNTKLKSELLQILTRTMLQKTFVRLGALHILSSRCLINRCERSCIRMKVNWLFRNTLYTRRCEPRVKGFRFEGVDSAEAVSGAKEATSSADAVVFCPSNPWVSIDPILKVIPIKDKPVYAVSPIIGGETVKGPAAKMYRELGIEPSAFAVANHYRGLATGFILDAMDAQLTESVRGLNMRALVTNTLMKGHEDRRQLASDVLNFIGDTK